MRNQPQTPAHLCETHRASWSKWARVEYNPRHPSEWPGGQVIMDARTSHADRAADWDRKTLAQLDLISGICARTCGTGAA